MFLIIDKLLGFERKLQRWYYKNYFYCSVTKNSNNAIPKKKDLIISGPITLEISSTGKIKIGDDFCIRSGVRNAIDNVPPQSKIVVIDNANLTIGNHVGMSNAVIHCHKQITIGDYVKIGAGCLIMDTNFHSVDWNDRMNYESDISNVIRKSIFIKDHAFIGARSIITKGITIGMHSIVATGSVVVCDIPDNEIWGGNPAKFIKTI